MLPSDNSLLRDLDPLPLSELADEALRRIRVFLFGIIAPAKQVPALLAGYTPDTHQTGVYLTSFLSGERGFGEWRVMRALRPSRDPDLPEVVEALETFVDDWLERAEVAAQQVPDSGEREEVLFFLKEDWGEESRTWRAKALGQRLEGFAAVPVEGYRIVWAELKRQGIEDALKRFHDNLRTVQDRLRHGPFEEKEAEEIHQRREEAAVLVQDWLQERRVEFASFEEVELTILGLGAQVPPPGFEPPLAMLSHFGPSAKA